MTFEDLLLASRDDEFRELRCKKPLQPPDPIQFLDLLGDTGFETAVEFGDLLGTLAQVVEEPSVLDRDDRLRGEILQQRYLLIGKGPDFLTIDLERA